MKKLLSLFVLAVSVALVFAGAAAALSDAEYKKMMKDTPAFAKADKELNQAWSAAKKGLDKAEFAKLKKEQEAWIASGRDKRAKALMADGMKSGLAYASATRERAQEIREKIQDAKAARKRSPKETKLLARTKGTWRIDGEKGTAYLVMDGKGNFEAYYASGSLEMSGTLKPQEEYDDLYCYVLHDKSGKSLHEGFYIDDSGTKLHFGNGDGPEYIKDKK